MTSSQTNPIPYSPAQKALAAMVLVLALASLWLLAVKVHFASYNQYFTTSGCEGAPIYSIWKVQHGHTLYESPKQSTLPLTVYNYLFYLTYGNILKAINCPAEWVLPVTKLISGLIAALGALLHWRLLRYLWRGEPPPLARRAGLCLVFVMWFGTSTLSWWALTARPDIGALVMTVAAMFCALKAVDRQCLKWMAFAAVFFYLAWSFKQAAVWGLVGVWFFVAIYLRHWRLLLALTLPYAALVGLTLWLGGSDYSATIIGLPSKSPISLRRALSKSFLEVFAPNPLFWGALLLAPWLWRNQGTTQGQTKDPLMVMLVFVAVTATLLGGVAVGRDGSERNHLFEGLLWAFTLAALVVMRLLAGDTSAKPWMPRYAVVLAALTMTLPVAQAFFPRVDKGKIHWNVTFADEAAYARKARLGEIIKQLPQPMFVADDILAQPWFTTSDRYPAIVLDQWVYFRAESFGLFNKDEGLPRLFRSQHFAALVLQPGNSLHRDAVAAGYRQAPWPAEQKPWLLLLRPGQLNPMIFLPNP
jgi:hypothetical protein